MHSNRNNVQDKVEVSSISYSRIVTAWDQESRNKKITKTGPTCEVMQIREANTAINLTKGHAISMFNEASP